jgi:LPXTG-site transpeptidase (sortase) family protein
VSPEPRGQQRRRATSPAALIRQGIGSAFLILSVCLLGFILWLALLSRLHYDRAQHAAYDALRVELAAGTAPNGPTQLTDNTKLLALGTPVAVLSIPAIGLRAVVLEGTTGQVLENGPGHLRDTPLPGQAGVSVIMGRRAAYGGPFSRLTGLNPGDVITTVTGQTVASYRVLDLRRAGDPTPPSAAAGQGRLILVTADGSPFVPSGLLYIDADLTSKPQPAPPMVLSAGNLSPSEGVLGTDTQAWLPIVLWGQLLLLVTMALSWLRNAWGRWQTWIIAVPVLGYVVLSVADEVTRLLPNLM